MKFAVLGATGRSGLDMVAMGLERGHTIKALVRSPDKITTKHERLEVVKCNIWDADELARNIAGCDVLMSCLGGDGSWFNRQPVTMYTDITKVIVSAMKKANCTWFIFMSSWYNKSGVRAPMIYKFTKFLIVGNILKNMWEAEQYLEKECNDVCFTAVRAPILTEGPVTTKQILSDAGKMYVKGTNNRLSRSDVVRYMIETAETGQWRNSCVAIGVPK